MTPIEDDFPEDLKVKPSMEFEGPLGKFWSTNEVPTECLFEALEELLTELKKRYTRKVLEDMGE